VGITNFEVIQSTGPAGGPRSPGAPFAQAGADFSVPVGVPMILSGWVHYTNTPPLAIQWRRYSGPTNVVIANATQTNATATFNAPGTYTLMLSASNGIHAVAYDAVVVAASSAIMLSLAPAEASVNLSWTGGTPPFVVERCEHWPAGPWNNVLTTSVQNASLPISSGTGFFRVRGN
jgi:hypothetical protein